jgi:hypothetical protein
MKTSKLKKFETVKTSLIVADTDEERQCLIAELLLIAERMPIEKIIPKNVTDIKSGDAEILDKNFVTKYNLSDAEKKIPENLTVFNSEELEILESLKDAEQ